MSGRTFPGILARAFLLDKVQYFGKELPGLGMMLLVGRLRIAPGLLGDHFKLHLCLTTTCQSHA